MKKLTSFGFFIFTFLLLVGCGNPAQIETPTSNSSDNVESLKIAIPTNNCEYTKDQLKEIEKSGFYSEIDAAKKRVKEICKNN